MKIKSLVFILLIIISISFARWERRPSVPSPVGSGGGITYGRGYIFAVVGNEREDFYAF
ncbi:MAG: hypothetical protein ABIK77_07790 [candidate division WOR-3 bacterium]